MHGIATRNVDDLGGSGICKSEVSRIWAGLDEEVGRFRTRRLDTTSCPYVFLDASYLHVHVGELVTSKAVVVATGLTAESRRKILGLDVDDSEDEVLWLTFLTQLKSRGLTGVKLVISDQHPASAAQQRCNAEPASSGSSPTKPPSSGSSG